MNYLKKDLIEFIELNKDKIQYIDYKKHKGYIYKLIIKTSWYKPNKIITIIDDFSRHGHFNWFINNIKIEDKYMEKLKYYLETIRENKRKEIIDKQEKIDNINIYKLLKSLIQGLYK